MMPTGANVKVVQFTLILLINLYLFYCELCQKNQIGDEYHYIFECTNLSQKRTSLLPKHLIECPNIIKIMYIFFNVGLKSTLELMLLLYSCTDF
jgi:hypothetical protein